MDLCVWGRGGKGGTFATEVPLLVEESILFGLNELRRALGLGPDAPIGGRDGESNATELDLALVPTPSQGFGGADIPENWTKLRKC